jgi:hypothetical protein
VTETCIAGTGDGKISRRYFGGVVAVFLVSNLANALYSAAPLPVPVGVNVLCYFLAATIVYSWFKRFAEVHGISLPFDMGWFLYLAWWAIVPLYLFKVQGRKAVRTILAVVAAYFITYGVSLVVLLAIA